MIPALAFMTPRLWKAAGWLLFIAGVVVGVWWFGESRYNDGVQETESKVRAAVEKQTAGEIAALHLAASQLQSVILDMQNAEPEIKTKYVTITSKSPLPDNCRYSADRLSVINGAIRASNAAGGTVTAKPANP